MTRSGRLWERRASHEDFAEVRFATGEQPLALTLTPLATRPVEDLEPLCAHALRRFIHTYATVDGQPVSVRLRSFARVLLAPAGEPGAGSVAAGSARATARAVVAQLAALHAPDELNIVVLADGEGWDAWAWTKWLPHTQHPTDTDGVGPARLAAQSVSELEPLLGEEFTARGPFLAGAAPDRDEPFTVVVLDLSTVPPGARLAGDGYRNTTVVDVRGTLAATADDRGTLRLRVTPEDLVLLGPGPGGGPAETRIGQAGHARQPARPAHSPCAWPASGSARPPDPSNRSRRTASSPTCWASATSPRRGRSSCTDRAPRENGCGCHSASPRTAPI